MLCVWCHTSFEARSDAKYCSVRCRQASWRFGVRRVELEATDRVMRLAYADPPYPGLARYYPEREEVDHAELLSRLQRYDGWALSTSAVALGSVLRLCPVGVRVCAWVKNPRSGSSWEPLLVWGGRRGESVVRVDALVYRGRYRAFPGAMIGMKPPEFSVWMFDLLGARSGDLLDDLFPGSGAVSEAWRRYTGRGSSEDGGGMGVPQPPYRHGEGDVRDSGAVPGR